MLAIYNDEDGQGLFIVDCISGRMVVQDSAGNIEGIGEECGEEQKEMLVAVGSRLFYEGEHLKVKKIPVFDCGVVRVRVTLNGVSVNLDEESSYDFLQGAVVAAAYANMV